MIKVMLLAETNKTKKKKMYNGSDTMRVYPSWCQVQNGCSRMEVDFLQTMIQERRFIASWSFSIQWWLPRSLQLTVEGEREGGGLPYFLTAGTRR